MTVLYILSFISILIIIIFLTVAIASALYYLAELVEEHTVIAKTVISWMILLTTVIYILFIFFDKLPWSMIISGFISQLLHAIILKNFPFVNFVSVSFLSAFFMIFVNHWFAYKFFSENFYQFREVVAYFTLCLWSVPFALFVSLSANDNILPTVNENSPLLSNNDIVTNYFSSKGKRLGLLSLFSYAKESILPQRNKKSY